MLPPVPVLLPELTRLGDLTAKLMLLENDADFVVLARELLAYMSISRLVPGDSVTPDERALFVLQLGYIAGIEAYERGNRIPPVK